MYIDKKEFGLKCSEIKEDINKSEIQSPAWIWVGLGAITGLALSCVKFKKRITKPILLNKEEKNGKSNSFRNRTHN